MTKLSHDKGATDIPQTFCLFLGGFFCECKVKYIKYGPQAA